MNITAHQHSRPLTVKIAVCLLVVSAGTDFVLRALRYQSHPSDQPGFYFSLVVVAIILSVLLYFLFRGYNWARWLVLLDIVVGTIQALAFPHRYHLGWYFASTTLINTAVVVALFVRPSNQWFRGETVETQTAS